MPRRAPDLSGEIHRCGAEGMPWIWDTSSSPDRYGLRPRMTFRKSTCLYNAAVLKFRSPSSAVDAARLNFRRRYYRRMPTINFRARHVAHGVQHIRRKAKPVSSVIRAVGDRLSFVRQWRPELAPSDGRRPEFFDPVHAPACIRSAAGRIVFDHALDIPNPPHLWKGPRCAGSTSGPAENRGQPIPFVPVGAASQMRQLVIRAQPCSCRASVSSRIQARPSSR